MRYWEALTIACLVIIVVSTVIIVRGYGTALQDNLGPTLKEQLLDRAKEWNIQKIMNDTLTLSERFNNYSSHHAEGFVCFNDLNDYFEFRLENENVTAAYPCPELDLKKIPKDESNK